MPTTAARPLAGHCTRVPRSAATRLVAAVLLVGAGAACGSDDDGFTPFEIRTGRFTAQADTLLVQSGNWAAYVADEALSNRGSLNADPDLPGSVADMDETDSIAIAVNLVDGGEFATGVEPREIVINGADFYFSADEAAGTDWNTDGSFDRVLVRWSSSLPAAEYVVNLVDHGGVDLARTASRVFFVQDIVPSGDETNLAFVESSSPDTPIVVSAQNMEGPLDVTLLGAIDGLVLCALDENANGNQNGDMDATDPLVLCLVDGDADTPVLVKTGLAVPDVEIPFAVERTDLDAWRVALFVSEQDQSDGSLNNASLFGGTWNPSQCTGGDDVDTSDFVVHVLDFEAGAITMGSVVNTGLSGVATAADNRIVLNGDVVACLSDEAGFGNGGCDYDGVGGATDTVLRWVDVTDLDSAGLTTAQMLAVDTTVPGGARGAMQLSGRLVVAHDTTFVVDGVNVTEPFLHWIDPNAATPTWSSDFRDAGGTTGTGFKAAVDYLDELPRASRVAIGLLESSVQQNLNRGCFAVDKDGIVGDGIGDIADTTAAWFFFNNAQNAMFIGGVGWAVDAGNTGLVVAGGQALFRVSESADGFDWNADGDTDDQVLFRSFVNVCEARNMGTLNDIDGLEAVVTSGVGGALFLVDESAIAGGVDLNGSGAAAGFAVRNFRF